jgi:uncharacterized protein YkwD
MIRFGAAMVRVLAACQPVPTQQSSSPVAPKQVVAQQGQMGALLNSQRSAQGLGPLVEDAALSRSANQGLNGSTFVQRARGAGYTCAAAENLAEGQRTEAAVVTAWMNSSGHRRNILLREATEFGIGRVDNMWVLVLGRGC